MSLIFFVTASPSDVMNDTLWFNALESRVDGSEGEREALLYIAAHLDNLKISYSKQYLNSGERGHSFSQNIIAEIPGAAAGRYILAAPIDGGAFSMAILLEFAKELSINPPKNTVVLAFLGAERGETRFHPYGSRIASERLNKENDIFAVYLAGDENPKNWNIRIGGDGKVAPYWLTEKVSDAFSSEFIPFRLRGTDIQVARLGLQGDIGSLSTWLKTEIPTILLEGSGTLQGNEGFRQINRLLNALSYIDFLLEEIPDNRESTYIFLRPFTGFSPRIISELPYVSVFLTISALSMFVILLRSRDVRLNLQRFSQYWWTGPLLFIIVFLFLFLSTLIVEETMLLSGFPDIWSYAPGTFVFFKLSIAAALSLNFILITRGLPLPRNPHFYSYAAIAVSGIATLVFIAIDITLAASSLWAIIFLMLFTATRKIQRKGWFLILSVIPYIMGLIVIIREPYSGIISSMLLDRISGNIILTLLLFPVILAITSLNYWKLHFDRTRYSVLTPAATFALSLSAIITTFWVTGLNPFDADNPQPVELIDHIDLIHGDRRLEMLSPGPIGDADLILDGNIYPLENLGRRSEVRMPFNRIPLSIESKSRSFLGRRTITGTISGESNPIRLVIHLKSKSPFTLHDANYPFEMSPSGTSAEIFIGDNPPFPMSIRFTVNADAELTISTVGIWLNPVEPPSVIRPDIRDSASRTARIEASI